MRRTAAFTLIEVIVSVTIFTVIIVAVYSAFYMGMKTWQRGQDGRAIQEIRLSFLKIEKELGKTFFFSKIPFEGVSDEVKFPLTFPDEELEKVYIIRYGVEESDTGSKKFIRKEKLFSGELEEDTEEKLRELIPLVRSVKFEYAYRSGGESNNFEWQDSWDPEEQEKLPSLVRVSLESNESEEVFSKVIFLQ